MLPLFTQISPSFQLYLFSRFFADLLLSGRRWFVPALLLALQLLLVRNTINAQGYLYDVKKVLVDPSLTTNRINDLEQDDNGFVWIASAVGLYRYDGYETEKINYSSTVNASKEYVSNLARQGDTLFIGDEVGIHAISCASYLPLNIKSKPSGKILALVSDTKSGVWWLNENGNLTHYKNSTTRSAQLQLPEKLDAAELFMKGRQVWIATTSFSGHKTLIFNAETFDFEQSESLTKPAEYVYSIREDVKGSITLSAVPQCYRWDEQSKTLLPREIFDKQEYDILQTKGQTFTINSEFQICHRVYTNSGWASIPIATGASKPEIIYKLYSINDCIYATSSNGLIIVQYKQNLFNTIFSTYDKVNKSFLVPRGITEDEQSIYLATYNHLIQYKKSTGEANIINTNTLAIRPLVKDHDTLWMGTEGGGIKKYLLAKNGNGKFSNDEILIGTTLLCMAELDEHRLITGGVNCLFTYDKRTKKTTPITVSDGKNVIEGRVNQIIVLSGNSLIIATQHGAYLIDLSGKILKDYSQNLTDLQEKTTYAALKLENTIWIATENGIFQLDEKGNIITHLTTSNGLAGKMVISLTKDKAGHLWAATFTGLSCIDIRTKSITNYYKENGLPDNEFNHSSFMLSNDGNIVLGSVNGFIKFNPTKLSFDEYSNATIRISKIESGGQQSTNFAMAYNNFDGNEIKLGKGINYVKINFCISPINEFGNTLYEYKIEGVHADWISLGRLPVLHIDNFKPGKYILSIRAITGSGSRHIITKSYRLVVEEYFYKTETFYAIIFLVFSVLVYLYFQSILKRNRKINEIRSLIAQDLHDEVGGYLTGITLNLELLQKNNQIDTKHFHPIQELGHKALKSLKDSLWSLDSKSDTAQELWDRVKNMASDTYEHLDMDYRFSQIDGLENIKLNMLQKSYLIFIIKECITNTIKHGDHTLVTFEWKKVNGTHTIIISNKIGAIITSLATRHGLFNMKNRMSKIKGFVSTKQEEGQFEVSIQLNFLS
jgi:ligand-binding sensor domain-containing protein